MERKEKMLYALTGLLAGLLSGFLGTGGGMVAAPMFMGPLKLPGLAASTSLRRSRKAGAARMDAG